MSSSLTLVFCGTPLFAVPTLQKLVDSGYAVPLVVTQPDRPRGRGMELTASPVKQCAVKLNLPITQPDKIKQNEEFRARLEAVKPDAIIVVGYGRIIPQWMLDLPRYGNLNLHASLLPKYRGAAPIQWAIASGEKITGVTTMRIDEGLDTGDILLEKTLPVLPDDTGGSLHDRLARLAPEALLEALDHLARGGAPRIRQDESRATYAPKLSRGDGRIDWKEPAVVIARKIRAYDPWPGTFTEVEDATGQARHLKIFRAVAREEPVGAPATVSVPNDREILVGTGQGSLQLEEVQLEGRRRMEAAEFLRGFSSPRLHF